MGFAGAQPILHSTFIYSAASSACVASATTRGIGRHGFVDYHGRDVAW
jgi:hypothetical protein